MSVFFTEARDLPAEFKNADLGQYGRTDAEAVASVFTAPFDFFKAVFVDKPAAEQAAQIELREKQGAAALALQNEANTQKRSTIKVLLYAGIGVAGLLALAMIIRRPAPAAVAGYRRKSRRSKRRSRR